MENENFFPLPFSMNTRFFFLNCTRLCCVLEETKKKTECMVMIFAVGSVAAGHGVVETPAGLTYGTDVYEM